MTEFERGFAACKKIVEAYLRACEPSPFKLTAAEFDRHATKHGPWLRLYDPESGVWRHAKCSRFLRRVEASWGIGYDDNVEMHVTNQDWQFSDAKGNAVPGPDWTFAGSGPAHATEEEMKNE